VISGMLQGAWYKVFTDILETKTTDIYNAPALPLFGTDKADEVTAAVRNDAALRRSPHGGTS